MPEFEGRGIQLVAKSFVHPSKKYIESLNDYLAGSRNSESFYPEFLWSYI
jgi:hypothetical protein